MENEVYLRRESHDRTDPVIGAAPPAGRTTPSASVKIDSLPSTKHPRIVRWLTYRRARSLRWARGGTGIAMRYRSTGGDGCVRESIHDPS